MLRLNKDRSPISRRLISLQFVTLLFSALALSTTSAHVLEFPQKMKLDITSYASINGQLYKFFAVIGGVYCLLAIVTAGAMVWLTRRHLYFRWWLAGFIFHVCWLLSWLFIVQPVNNAVAKSSATSLHYLWSSLRMQWELGHVVGFIFHLLALSCLLVAVLKFNRPGAL